MIRLGPLLRKSSSSYLLLNGGITLSPERVIFLLSF
jgi:hypothetical protein